MTTDNCEEDIPAVYGKNERVFGINTLNKN